MAPPEPDDALGELEERLGHRFGDRALLARALTHPSRAHEEGAPAENYERLEFLGDAVLDLLVSELLMEQNPEASEGVLSQARAASVNRAALAARAQALGLDRFVRLGKGEQSSPDRGRAAILADVFESVLGALYLDAGLEVARQLVARELGPELGPAELDAKSRLSQWLQARARETPTYEVQERVGPSHAPHFQVVVRVDRTVVASGEGPSKRAAEQEAAARALDALETSEP